MLSSRGGDLESGRLHGSMLYIWILLQTESEDAELPGGDLESGRLHGGRRRTSELGRRRTSEVGEYPGRRTSDLELHMLEEGQWNRYHAGGRSGSQ